MLKSAWPEATKKVPGFFLFSTTICIGDITIKKICLVKRILDHKFKIRTVSDMALV